MPEPRSKETRFALSLHVPYISDVSDRMTSILAKALREPLLHFAGLAAALFAIGALAGRDDDRIEVSRAAAELDVLASLAEAATRFDYVKPRLSRGDELAYGEGRHPIMERVLRDPFVAAQAYMAGETTTTSG